MRSNSTRSKAGGFHLQRQIFRAGKFLDRFRQIRICVARARNHVLRPRAGRGSRKIRKARQKQDLSAARIPESRPLRRVSARAATPLVPSRNSPDCEIRTRTVIRSSESSASGSAAHPLRTEANLRHFARRFQQHRMAEIAAEDPPAAVLFQREQNVAGSAAQVEHARAPGRPEYPTTASPSARASVCPD